MPVGTRARLLGGKHLSSRGKTCLQSVILICHVPRPGRTLNSVFLYALFLNLDRVLQSLDKEALFSISTSQWLIEPERGRAFRSYRIETYLVMFASLRWGSSKLIRSQGFISRG